MSKPVGSSAFCAERADGAQLAGVRRVDAHERVTRGVDAEELVLEAFGVLFVYATPPTLGFVPAPGSPARVGEVAVRGRVVVVA